MKGPNIHRFAASAFLALGAFLVWKGEVSRALFESSSVAVQESPGRHASIGDASRIEGPPHQISGCIRRGDILATVLTKAGVAPGLTERLVAELARVFDPRAARPGDTFHVVVDPEMSLVGFQYDRVSGESYRVEPRGDGISAHSMPLDIETRLVRREGILESSLFDAVRDAGGSADEVDLVADIFGGSFDFFTECRRGDTFSYLFEEESVNGRPRGTGRVLCAEYSSQAREKLFTGFHYVAAGARKGAYYSADGSPLSRRFLRAPLAFTRISSRFSLSRLHPVSGKRKPHLGVDFAAPAGTPVSVVADGVVTEARYKGGLGHCVSVRHAGGIETTYGHLSRYGAGMRPGARVEQSDVIGYVGSTGISTGPHLHFCIEKGGRLVDPLRFESEGGPPLPAAEMLQFARERDRLVETRLALPANVELSAPVALRDREPAPVVTSRS